MQKFNEKSIKSILVQKGKGQYKDYYKLTVKLKMGETVDLALFKEGFAKNQLLEFIPVESEIFEILKSNAIYDSYVEYEKILLALKTLEYFSENLDIDYSNIVDVIVGRESSEDVLSGDILWEMHPEISEIAYINVVLENQKLITAYAEKRYSRSVVCTTNSVVPTEEIQKIESIIEKKYSDSEDYDKVLALLDTFKSAQPKVISYKKPQKKPIQNLIVNLEAMFKFSNNKIDSDKKHL